MYNIISTKKNGEQIQIFLKINALFRVRENSLPSHSRDSCIFKPSFPWYSFIPTKWGKEGGEKKKETKQTRRNPVPYCNIDVRLFPATEQSRVSREYFDANGTPLLVITSQCACTAHKFHGDFTSNHLLEIHRNPLMNKRNKSTVGCSIVIAGISPSTLPSFV